MVKQIIVYIFLLLFCLSSLCSAVDITVRWDANTETDLAGYNLYYKSDTPGSPYEGTGAVQGSSPVNIPLTTVGFDLLNPEFTLTDLDAAYIYFLVLTAYDDVGNESGYSNEVQTFYISSPQDGFIINSNNYTAFNVSGRAAAGVSVDIYSDDVLIGTVMPIADGSWSININFDGVTEGQIVLRAETYTTEIINSNTVDGTLDYTAPAPPSIPQNLSAEVMSSNQINLDWDDVDGTTGYTVYRNDVDIGTINESNYNDYDLEPSTTYEYEIATIENPNDRSDLVSATTLAENVPPVTPPSSSSGGGCFISCLK